MEDLHRRTETGHRAQSGAVDSDLNIRIAAESILTEVETLAGATGTGEGDEMDIASNSAEHGDRDNDEETYDEHRPHRKGRKIKSWTTM